MVENGSKKRLISNRRKNKSCQTKKKNITGLKTFRE